MIADFLIHLLDVSLVLLGLFVFVAIFLRAFRINSPRVHRIAWGGTLVIPFLALTVPLNVPWLAPQTVPVAQETVPVEYFVPENHGPPPMDVETVRRPVEISRVSQADFERVPDESETEIDSVPMQMAGEPVSALPAGHPGIAAEYGLHPRLLGYGVFAIWCFGLVFLLGKRVRLHWKLVRYLNAQSEQTAEGFADAAGIWEHLLTENGIAAKKIPLLLTDSLGPALVRRGLRYYLLIPQTVCEELPERLLRGMMLHELAHYRNGDGILTPVFRLFAALLWFHPMAWKSLRNYETAVEWSCDEFAYLRPGQSGSSLLAETFLLVHQSTESLVLNLNSFARFNTLERVDRLARTETFGKDSIMKQTLILALLGLVFFCGTLRVRLVAQEEKPTVTKNVVQESGHPGTAPGTALKESEEGVITGTVNIVVPYPWTAESKPQPVAGAVVRVPGEKEERIVADQDGKFTLRITDWTTPFRKVFAFNPEKTLFGNAIIAKNATGVGITLTPARRITGTVLGTDGKPVEGCTVYGAYQSCQTEKVKTDAEGKFEFLFPEGYPMLHVAAYKNDVGFGFTPTKEKIDYFGKPPADIDNGPFTVKLLPLTSVKFRVADVDGQPIPGAMVTPWVLRGPEDTPFEEHWRYGVNTSGNTDFFVHANAEGIAELKMIPQGWVETTSYFAYGPGALGISTSAPKEKRFGQTSFGGKQFFEEQTEEIPTITLPRQAVVRGTVKFENGKPAKHTAVSVRTHSRGGHGGRSTNENGEFELVENARELLNIGVESLEGAAPGIFGFDVGDGSEEKKIEIVLKKGIRLHGVVYMPDGKPAKGFGVWIDEIDPSPPASYTGEWKRELGVYDCDQVTRQTSDKTWDGKGEYEYLLPAVPRKYRLRANKNPSEDNKTELQDYRGDFQLAGTETEIRIDFRLKPFDRNVCDPEPEYSEDVKSRQYAGTGPKPTADPNDTPTANPMIPENPVIKVVDDDGKPMKDVEIQVRYWGDQNGNFKVKTDEHGVASVKELLEKKGTRGVVYSLEKSGYVYHYADWERPKGSENVLPKEFSFRMQKGIEIGGIVLDENNKPIEGATVECSFNAPDRKNFLLGAGKPKTNAEGKWTTRSAPPEIKEIRLDVKHPDYISSKITGTYPPYELLENKTAPIILQKGITINGTVRDPDGKPVKGARIRITKAKSEFNSVRPPKTDDAGAFSIKNWEAGPAVVYVAFPGFAPETKEILVEKGKDVPPVDFQLKPGKTIRFKILDKRGNPISEARVGPFRWRGSFMLLGGDELIKQEADRDGNWAWTWAPDDKAEYSIRKTGFMRIDNLWLEPREEPYVYTMNDPLTVSGKVIDAVTKKAIPEFFVTTGGNFDGKDKTKASYWNDDNKEKRADGTYRVIITSSRPEGGHHFKIEAPGYKPYVSEMLTDEQGAVNRDLELSKEP